MLISNIVLGTQDDWCSTAFCVRSQFGDAVRGNARVRSGNERNNIQQLQAEGATSEIRIRRCWPSETTFLAVSFPWLPVIVFETCFECVLCWQPRTWRQEHPDCRRLREAHAQRDASRLAVHQGGVDREAPLRSVRGSRRMLYYICDHRWLISFSWNRSSCNNEIDSTDVTCSWRLNENRSLVSQGPTNDIRIY